MRPAEAYGLVWMLSGCRYDEIDVERDVRKASANVMARRTADTHSSVDRAEDLLVEAEHVLLEVARKHRRGNRRGIVTPDMVG